jgi:adenylate cyclase
MIGSRFFQISILAGGYRIRIPKQEYLSDGITEQIITGLSTVPYLFVIARNSTFTYKGRAVKVSQVSRELGVRYVLEGSVQRSGERIRITAQLIDATTGRHLWAERYDRELKDIFAIQDEITMKIMAGLQVKLTAGEQGRLIFNDTDNFEALLRLLQGVEQFDSNNPGAIALAREMFEEAIALDAEYATAYSLLGYTHMLDVYLGSSKSPKESLERGMELAQKAITLDDSNFHSYSLLGYLYTLMRQHDKALVAACYLRVDQRKRFFFMKRQFVSTLSLRLMIFKAYVRAIAKRGCMTKQSKRVKKRFISSPPI